MAYTWRTLSRALTAIGAVGCVVLFVYAMLLIGNYAARQLHKPGPERGWTGDLIWTDPASHATPSAENRQLWIPCCFAAFLYLIVLGQAMNMYIPDDDSGVATRQGAAVSRRTASAIGHKISGHPRLHTRDYRAACPLCTTEEARLPAGFTHTLRHPADTSTCR
jgi:hypothetical protein